MPQAKIRSCPVSSKISTLTNHKPHNKIALLLALVMTFVITSCDHMPSDAVSQSDTEISSPSDTSGDSSSNTSSDSDSSTSSDPVFIYEDYYNDYYDSIESWEDGDDLREQLRELINYDVTLVDFDGSNKWAINQLADEAFDNFDRVNLVYSDYQPLKSYTFTGSNQGWQREHAFAQTLGNFDVNNSRPPSEAILVNQMRSDFHNLFASDGRLNNSRGNKNLGNVSEEMGTVVYPTDYFGNQTGCRAIESVDEVGVSIFEPRPEDKPMMARGIFYMATRFDDLDVVEGISATRSKTHGMLSDLLTWADGEVSRREYKHNLGVYAFQNNRNPYVDFPDLVDYVFGEKKDEAGVLNKLRPSYYDVVIDEGEQQPGEVRNLGIKDLTTLFQVGHSFSKADDLKVFTVNNDFSLSTYLSTAEFDVSISDGHTFTIGDVGKIQVNVTHQDWNVTYEIEVQADSSLLATYQYTLTSTDPFAAFRNVTGLNGIVHEISLGSLDYNFYFASGKLYNFDAANGRGRQFGTSTAPINNMYLETKDDFSFGGKANVNAVYIVASTATTGVDPKLDVSIGAYSFAQRSMTIGVNNVMYEFVLPEGQSYTGKVRLAFSGFTGGALYLNRFAINAVS